MCVCVYIWSIKITLIFSKAYFKYKSKDYDFIILLIIYILAECSPMVRETGVQSGGVMLKTQKMVLDVTLLNTQHYKVRIKGEVGQFRE